MCETASTKAKNAQRVELNWRSQQGMIIGGLLAVLFGLGLFAKGFFLTRVELKDVGQCSHSAIGSEVCNFPHTFDKVIIIVIDALRLDFVFPSALDRLHDPVGLEGNKASSNLYLNRLVTLRNLLLDKPNHTLLARFDADPPTTTMQRLKGITTGGLPTFIDIKDDVASEKIFEDNLMAQLRRRGKRVTFMGDDTWVKLFPDLLSKQFPYDSFNVKDLDTLDNGVISHLIPELRNSDWDVLVAHFLGVDHAGHRYGPRHPEMTRKLIQMDDVLDGLIKELDTKEKTKGDTLLLVFGDHGMTEDGNHGGATEEERSAAFFAYSPHKKLFKASHLREKDMPTVQQVDLAPTFALLLDVPIPFGSLGFMVPDFVGVSWQAVLTAARANVDQILYYLKSYSARVNSAISLETLEEWQREVEAITWNDSSSTVDLNLALGQLQMVARKAAKEARGMWTQFNFPLMLTGMAFGVGGVVASMVAFVNIGGLPFSKTILNTLPPVGLTLSWITGVLALTSNSYIVAEMNVSLFALATSVFLDVYMYEGTEFRRFIRRCIAAMVVARTSLYLEEYIRSGGHEIRDEMSWIVHGAIPLLSVLFTLDRKGTKRGVYAIFIALQATMAVAFWFASSRKVPANMLAQGTYASVMPCMAVAPDFGSVVRCLFVPMCLILGPAGPLALVAFIIIARFFCEELYFARSAFWRGVALAQLSVLWFFVTGHSCVFGTLRITAPYVGFEEFGYWRGIVMLSLDTFSAHLIGVAASLYWGGERAVLGFLLVFASRAVVMMVFVFFTRRHLMVWAIFAPKFIFDTCAYVASVFFAGVLVSLRRGRFDQAVIDKGKDV